jgi:O-antigen/teichoic acid export membrane protein
MIPEPAVPAAPDAAASARRVARNSVLPFASGLGARLLTWLLAMVMARTLGPAGTGAYALVVNLWLYASIVADFGLGTWLTREVARRPERARQALADTLGLRLVLGAATIPVLAGAAGAYATAGADPAIVATAALLGVGLLPGAVSASVTALFNAHERMGFPAAVQLASAALTAAAGAAVLWWGGGIVGLGWVSLLVNLVTAAVFLLACARCFFPLSVALHWARQRAVLQDSLPLMLNSLLNSVFFRIDVQLLQSQGSAQVGYYSNAYKIIDAAGAVPSSFVLALFPVLSRRAAAEGAGGSAGLLPVYRLAIKLLMAAALPAALLVTLAAHDLTRWLWGDAFLPESAIALQILIWFLPLSFFNGLTQYVLIAAGLQRRITVAFAIAALFNLGANLVLIPRFSYKAAAGVTIASELVLMVPFLLALRHRLPVGALLAAALLPIPDRAERRLILSLLPARWGQRLRVPSAAA